eukprot:GHVS01080774.1.p1 GENE.GHVS01080774.1~~GHVS01080774.1.p1  ORF type:complete len:146 (-),score=60.98 GHVS01080774.1:524-961(-)
MSVGKEGEEEDWAKTKGLSGEQAKAARQLASLDFEPIGGEGGGGGLMGEEEEEGGKGEGGGGDSVGEGRREAQSKALLTNLEEMENKMEARKLEEQASRAHVRIRQEDIEFMKEELWLSAEEGEEELRKGKGVLGDAVRKLVLNA